MRIESKLCYVSENKAVVQVNGWINDKNLGSALAEGQTVEIAEDKAILRLNTRINSIPNTLESNHTIKEDKINTPIKVQLPKGENIENIKLNDEPSDWSDELTEIDSEILRLKWSRDDEMMFLKKTFGYNHRNKITNYRDIVKYLSLLKKTDNQSKSKLVNVNILSLIEQSDKLLSDLSWDHTQGRQYLQKEFNVSTRKELNEIQLISFVEKLESIRNQYLNK
tara:strand:- start:21 stop:689 length:669 start_codon:yes stop_codon:yes gene_type:complete